MVNDPTQTQTNRQGYRETLRIFQLNLNKSDKAHLEIINRNLSSKYDLILIQEPHTTPFNAIRTPHSFRPVFPSNRLQDNSQIRSVIWVNRQLNTNQWEAVDIPDSNDITAI